MIENFHVSVILKSDPWNCGTLMFLILLTLRTDQKGHDLTIHWNQDVYFC